MPRRNPREPWLHEASGFWCKKVAGELHYLDRDYQTAKRKLATVLRDLQRRKSGYRDWLDAPFAVLCEEYLDDVKARRELTTYEGYRYRLLRALRVLGSTLRVGDVRRFHIAKVEQALKSRLSPTTVRDTIATVQGVFQWAVCCDLLDSNPLLGYVKPAARARTRIITRDEFRALLRALADNPAFRRVLIALRLTGCRPKEVRKLTWEMVDLERKLWIIPKHKTVTMQRRPRPRIIPLPKPIWRMCRWLAQQPIPESGHVFVNMHGQPYTKDRFVKTLARARKRAGIQLKGEEQIVLYSNRHTYGTEAAGKVTDIELAELMGHTTTQTTKRYVHLNALRLHDIQRRVHGSAIARGSG